MARIEIQGDYKDPYENYAGGSSSFDEMHPPTPEPAPKFTTNMKVPDEGNGGGSPSPSPSAPASPSAPNTGANQGDIEKQLRDRLGSLFDQSIVGDVVRNTSYANNQDSMQGWIDRIVNKNLLRGTNEANSTYTPNGQGGYTTGPTGIVNNPRAATSAPAPAPHAAGGAVGGYSAPGVNQPGSQFNDPYTNLLEQIAHNQINSLTGQNPQMTQLMDFLNKQFSQLSNSNGYTPDELAVLNTQALEPIEAMRHASQQRELHRTSAAGYLPTSGITLDQQRQIDTSADQARTAANRDLAINGINRQQQQRQQAVQFGTQALQLPQQQNAQALDVANILYQLPRQAMMDANTIVNGSSPQSVISPYIQLMQQQQQAQLLQQQQSDAWLQNIGSWLYNMFNNGNG